MLAKAGKKLFCVLFVLVPIATMHYILGTNKDYLWDFSSHLFVACITFYGSHWAISEPLSDESVLVVEEQNEDFMVGL